MDKNLSWTSALGEAYVNQPQGVMNAVQEMRLRGQNSGNLQSTPQEKVRTQGQTIEIQPVNPEVVCVPEYNPWVVYGPHGQAPCPGLHLATPGIVFGLGIGIGLFAGFGWGWHHWGFNWAHRAVVFNHRTYISHSTTFINRRTVVSHDTFVNHRSFARAFSR